MVDFYRDSNEIKETDIIFDCPNCGKSLAIDYRGAGLTIPCTDCGQYVDVPIPEGMELTDIDGSDEEQEMRILNLRRSLGVAEGRIAELESKLAASASAERDPDATADGNGQARANLAAIEPQIEELRRHLQGATAALARIAALLQPEPQPAEAEASPEA